MEEIEWGRATPSPGPALSFKDVAGQAFEDQKRVSNDSAHYWNLVDTYDEVNGRIKQATGVDLPNPARENPTTGRTTFGVLQQMDPISNWRKQVGEIKANPKHATALSWDGIEDEPDRLAWEKMRAVREATGAQRDRTGTVETLPYVGKVPVLGSLATFGYNALTHPQYAAAELVGSLGAQALSPGDLIPNALGFGSGKYTDSILKAALKNAAANAAIQAPLSAVKQGDYKKAGLPYGWDVWMREVEGAAATGALIDAGVRAPGRTAIQRFGRDTPAGTTLSRNTERGGWLTDAPERANLPPSPIERPAISPELVKKAEAGDVEALREIATKTGAIEDPAIKGMVDYVETHGAIDDATVAFFRGAGIDNGEGLKAVAHGLRGETGHVRMPDPVVPAKTPLAIDEARALLIQKGPEIETLVASLEPRVARLVQDGLDAGIPEIVKAVSQHLAAPDDLSKALTRIEDAIGGPDKLDDLVEIHAGRNGPLATAAAMRRSPELIDSNVSLRTDFMQGARAIAALDDAAFERVMAGDVPPAVAAVVSDLVSHETQARVIADLAKARITDSATARDVIPDLIPGPKAEMPLDGGAGIKEPNDAAAKAQTKRLEAENAEAVAQAMAPIEMRRQVESQIETVKGEIVGLERKQDAELGREPKPEAAPREPEPNPVAEAVGQIGDALGVDVRPLVETPADVPAAKVSVTQELMAKRAERDALIAQKADLDAQIDGKPGLAPALRAVLESAALQRAADVRRAIGDALRLANQMLPEGQRIDIAQAELRDPVTGALLDAMSDVSTGDITLATYALNPSARLGHEGLHTLVTRGLVSPQEVRMLARMVQQLPGLFDEAKYREAYKDRPNLDGLIEEEAAAHVIENVIAGKISVDTPSGVVARIKMMVQRVRNALHGYGFQTEQDLARAIVNGDVARRQARQEWMRQQDITAGSVKPDGTLFAFAGERAKTADHAVLAEAKTMEGEGKDRTEIWTKTGWFKGVDGKWRFEIDDSQAEYLGGVKSARRFDKVIDHPDLAAAYPGLGASPVRGIKPSEEMMGMEPTPPLHIEAGMIDKMTRMSELVAACR